MQKAQTKDPGKDHIHLLFMKKVAVKTVKVKHDIPSIHIFNSYLIYFLIILILNNNILLSNLGRGEQGINCKLRKHIFNL